ncbi:glycosyltransferase [Candidatus Sumerlaeota bacterium]|nr:glycosyltransferase [Candidatus Sumerlaeota bacterium]
MSARKILILSHNFRHVGTYFRARQIARHFVRQGCDTTFIYIGQDNRFRPIEREEDGLRIIESPNYSHLFNWQEGWSAFDWWARLGVVREQRFDQIFCFGHKPDILLPARHAQFWRASTVIADWCDMWGGPDGIIEKTIKPSADYRQRRFYQRWARAVGFAVEKQLEQRFCRNSHGAMVICDYLRCACMLQGMDEERVQLIYTGCDTEKVRVEDQAECRREWELEPDDEVLGYIGNFQPDTPILLGALRILAQRRPKLKLLAAGAGFGGGIARDYSPETAACIRHAGFQPFERISSLLGACDVLLLPMADVTLNRARWPHKFTDYLASGRPVACSNVGDVAGFVERHETGLRSEPNAEAFAECIHAMLDQSGRLPQWGANARRLAENELSWPHQLKKLDAWLERIEEKRNLTP